MRDRARSVWAYGVANLCIRVSFRAPVTILPHTSWSESWIFKTGDILLSPLGWRVTQICVSRERASAEIWRAPNAYPLLVLRHSVGHTYFFNSYMFRTYYVVNYLHYICVYANVNFWKPTGLSEFVHARQIHILSKSVSSWAKNSCL